MPWWLAGTTMVATTFAADTPLAVTELVAKNGIAGNWLWWNMVAGTVLTVFFFAQSVAAGRYPDRRGIHRAPLFRANPRPSCAGSRPYTWACS